MAVLREKDMGAGWRGRLAVCVALAVVACVMTAGLVIDLPFAQAVPGVDASGQTAVPLSGGPGVPCVDAASCAADEPVAPDPVPFSKVGQPSISGTKKVGATLTAKPGSWSPKASFTYRWYRNSKMIAKAAGPTYKTVAADGGTKLAVRVEGSAPGRVTVWSKVSRAVKVKPGSTYIDVNMATQKLRYVKNGSLAMSFNVVTGLPSKGKSSTPTGTFTITQKLSPHRLFYNETAKYWMRLDHTHIGLHDAPWQTHFGGTWYKTNGSHGCVNLPPADAKRLYAQVKVGTKVTIHK